MYLKENLKFLRKKHRLSQQSLADELDIPRTTLGDYERGHTEPNIEILSKIAEKFELSLDSLIREKIEYQQLEIASGPQFKVLAITVNDDNQGNIELVDTKAEAGYLQSFQDPEYIRELPKIKFPNIPDGSYRGFEIQGDSMLPIEPGSIAICQYVEALNQVKDNELYVIASQKEGLVFKRVVNQRKEKSLRLISDNELYIPYELPYSEIDELWSFYALLCFSDLKKQFQSQLDEKISDIQLKVNAIHHSLEERGDGAFRKRYR